MRMRPVSSTVTVPQAGTRLFALGAFGWFQYSTRPMRCLSDLRAGPRNGSGPDALERRHVVLGHRPAIETAEVEGRVGRGRFSVYVCQQVDLNKVVRTAGAERCSS